MVCEATRAMGELADPRRGTEVTPFPVREAKRAAGE
jgi:hypothetical protein